MTETVQSIDMLDPIEDRGGEAQPLLQVTGLTKHFPVRGGLFDVKHSPGGMVDVEFAVQYLVLSQSASHPELMANLGNIALLQRAEQAGLIPAGVGQQAARAYRELRRLQHVARLDERSAQLVPGQAEPLSAPVKALWDAVFANAVAA